MLDFFAQCLTAGVPASFSLDNPSWGGTYAGHLWDFTPLDVALGHAMREGPWATQHLLRNLWQDKGWIWVSPRLLPSTFGRLSLSEAWAQWTLRVQLFPQ